VIPRSPRRRGWLLSVALIAAAVFAGGAADLASAAAAPPDAPLTVTGVPIDTVRGTPLTNQRVATFTDADPAGVLSDYTATIDWGDGTTTPGAVVANGAAGFAVNGTHTYSTAGVFTVVVTVHDVGGATASTQIAAGISLPGGQIAFQRGATSEIWMMNADGSGQAQLTSTSAGQFWDPAWSADGRQLATGAIVNGLRRPVFQAAPLNTALLTVPEPGVWLMNADASGLARLALVQQPSAAAPTLSRDGRFVTYVDSGSGRDIFSAAIALPHPLFQLTNRKTDYDPAWSPTGKTIAFTNAQNGPSHQHIFMMNRDGSGRVPVGSDTAENYSPAWSPGGDRLAFARAVPGSPSQLFVMGAGGGGARLVTATAADNPSWSPEGARIAFTALLPNGRREIRVINADGTGEHRIATDADEPAWRPSQCTSIRFCIGPIVTCVQCPVLTASRIVSPAFRVGPRPTAVSARSVPSGTTFAYTVSTNARVQIRILRIRTGHLRGGRCVSGAAPRGGRACLLASSAGTLLRRGRKGTNTASFSGRIGSRALGPGHYQAEFVAIDARGRRSAPRLLDFDVVS
jgi:WD40 repeat protein